MAMAMVRVYEDAAVSLAAMPVIAGRKSRLESFAGADTTYTIEAMMGDCRALQARSHHAQQWRLEARIAPGDWMRKHCWSNPHIEALDCSSLLPGSGTDSRCQ